MSSECDGSYGPRPGCCMHDVSLSLTCEVCLEGEAERKASRGATMPAEFETKTNVMTPTGAKVIITWAANGKSYMVAEISLELAIAAASQLEADRIEDDA